MCANKCAALATAAAAQGRAFSSDEIRWFACKSYGIALELYKQSSVQAVFKMLDISTKVVIIIIMLPGLCLMGSIY